MNQVTVTITEISEAASTPRPTGVTSNTQTHTQRVSHPLSQPSKHTHTHTHTLPLTDRVHGCRQRLVDTALFHRLASKVQLRQRRRQQSDAVRVQKAVSHTRSNTNGGSVLEGRRFAVCWTPSSVAFCASSEKGDQRKGRKMGSVVIHSLSLSPSSSDSQSPAAVSSRAGA